MKRAIMLYRKHILGNSFREFVVPKGNSERRLASAACLLNSTIMAFGDTACEVNGK